MADNLLNLRVTEPARIAHDTLGLEDRRLVDAWFDHLRNWRNDDFIRTKSRRLKSDGDVYVFQTSGDLLIAFEIADNNVNVLSIFRKEALNRFEGVPQRSAS